MAAQDFDALRAELELPPAADTATFPPDVLAEAERLADAPPDADLDLTDVPFVTIDPPGAMDLDQAVHLERDGDGFRVRYAIADLGSAIELGSAIDREARRRGQTIYLPDGRVPLHPPVLSEGTLSLLPDVVRPAAVWDVRIAGDGRIGEATVRRARVRSVARLDYATVQRGVDDGDPHPSIASLRDLGELRRRVRLADGAIDLAMPAQEVVATDDGWTVRLEQRTEADGWNAEISILTGMAAARLMLEAGVGIVRTLPAADADEVEVFLDVARGLGIEVPRDATPGQVLTALDMSQPESMGLTAQATRLLRGAGYAAFDGTAPDDAIHAGIGGAYAHVTAPLRRLVDRFTAEVCLALSAGDLPAPDLVAALPEVVERMAATDRVASAADRNAIDQVEVWVMQQHRDDTFEAVVLRAAEDDRSGEVMVSSPAVLADCRGDGLEVGRRVTVRIDEIDPAERRVGYLTV